jgi:hypothetical protein
MCRSKSDVTLAFCLPQSLIPVLSFPYIFSSKARISREKTQRKMVLAHTVLMIFFLYYYVTPSVALDTRSETRCGGSLVDFPRPPIASCYAAIKSMSADDVAVEYHPDLWMSIYSGKCWILLHQTLGAPASSPKSGLLVSKEHIIWPILQKKTTKIVQKCFERRDQGWGVTTMIGLFKNTVVEFQVIMLSRE